MAAFGEARFGRRWAVLGETNFLREELAIGNSHLFRL